MDAKLRTGLASLQEELDYLRIKKMENNDLNTVQVMDFSYEDYPATGFLHRVNYGSGETYVFDMNYIDRVNKELSKSLDGGYGVNGTIYQLKDVYGVNEDFTVWYRDSDGKLYGTDKIREVAIDPETKVAMSHGLMESMGLTNETANIGNTRGKSNVEIDGSKMTTKITNLDDLSLMPNLTWLKLKNLTLDNVDGLQYLTQLNKITFNNTTVTNLDGLKYANLVTGFYLINGSITNENMAAVTAKFTVMPKLEIVRIRNNAGLTSIPALTSLGNVPEIWIEENANLMNIYGLSTVQNKNNLKVLYLNENNITDVINTTDVHETYGYLLPLLEMEVENPETGEKSIVGSGNVINMSYLDGYSKLEELHFEVKSGYYEDGVTSDSSYNTRIAKIKYLNGIDYENNLVGENSLTSIKEMNFKDCDLLDCQCFSKYQSLTSYTLEKVTLTGNTNLAVAQINMIIGLMSEIDFILDGTYISYLDNNKPNLDFTDKGLTDLSFLAGNTVTTSLNLENCQFDDSQIGYIGAMTQLQTLDMDFNKKVTDFSFLSTLTSLKSISFACTMISSSDIENYIINKNLITRYWFYGCKNITNLDFVESFPNAKTNDIRYLGIPDNQDLSVFDNSNSKSFYVTTGDLSTIQNLISHLDSVFGLHCGNQPEEGSNSILSKLGNCTELTSLYLSSGSLSRNENEFKGTNSIDLSLCKKITKIYFMRVKIENVCVDGCEKLQSFTMVDMMRGSKSCIIDFSNNHLLKDLTLSKNYYSQSDLVSIANTLKPVYNEEGQLTSGTPVLETIYLNQNQFNSVAPICVIPSLKEVYITDNELVTLSGIESLTNLTILDIRNNSGITNVQPIIDLMENIQDEKGESASLTVYISGCSGILNASTDLVKDMTDAGITVVK